MKELKSILAVTALLVGGFVLYKVVPAYWNNYELGQMISEQAIYFTNYPKSDEEIRMTVAQKAQDYDVPLAPEQVDIARTPGTLSISVDYKVRVDLPGHPFDLNFRNSTTNRDVMR